jgi:hypothetical protein
MRQCARAACGVVLALLCTAPASAGSPIAGTWSSTIDWGNRQAGLYVTLAIGADGHLRERVMNHMGMAYDLIGTYRMDATGRIMRFTWTDYAPKRICVGGNCTPMGQPQRLGIAHTSRIKWLNPNFFIGTTDDGASTKWTRLRAQVFVEPVQRALPG